MVRGPEARVRLSCSESCPDSEKEIDNVSDCNRESTLPMCVLSIGLRFCLVNQFILLPDFP